MQRHGGKTCLKENAIGNEDSYRVASRSLGSIHKHSYLSHPCISFCFIDEESNEEVTGQSQPGSARAKTQVGLTAKICALLYYITLAARVKNIHS